MRFTKMQGAGNDYVYVDVTKTSLEDPGRISRRISDRHFGIGSDGLILIGSSDKADFRMIMYNADGSEGSMCGNGIRCVGKYVYDHGLTDKTEITVETGSGIKTLTLYPENGKITRVRVDMGCPVFEPKKIPVDIAHFLSGPESEMLLPRGTNPLTPDAKELINVPIMVDRYLYTVSALSIGNPHCVVFITHEPGDYKVTEVGPLFETHPAFPDRVNTEFVYIRDEHRIAMRVWERGANETLACGTGACACVVAGIKQEKLVSPVTVELLGGELEIEWAGGTSPVYMTGPAETVFEGEIEL